MNSLKFVDGGAGLTYLNQLPVVVLEVMLWCRTPDEDFSILLEAAVMYDRRVAAILREEDSTDREVLWKEMYDGRKYPYPSLLFIITGNMFRLWWNHLTSFWCCISWWRIYAILTGKGPEKEKYEKKIRALNLKRVAFRTIWLSAEDYPLLLGIFFIFISISFWRLHSFGKCCNFDESFNWQDQRISEYVCILLHQV